MYICFFIDIYIVCIFISLIYFVLFVILFFVCCFLSLIYFLFSLLSLSCSLYRLSSFRMHWHLFWLAAAFVCNPAHQLCAGQYPVLPRQVSPHAWIEKWTHKRPSASLGGSQPSQWYSLSLAKSSKADQWAWKQLTESWRGFARYIMTPWRQRLCMTWPRAISIGRHGSITGPIGMISSTKAYGPSISSGWMLRIQIYFHAI